eukprot:gene2342-2565_t
MSVSLQQSLISARFLTTFGHFIALLTLFSTVEENVNLGLKDGYSEEEHRAAMTTAWAALIFAFMCFVLDFSGLFFGTSLFYVKAHVIHIFFHFVGGIFLSWLITLHWSYHALWPIVVSCNLPTALYELSVLLGIYVFKVIVY